MRAAKRADEEANDLFEMANPVAGADRAASDCLDLGAGPRPA
jgi:hypothetical protein